MINILIFTIILLICSTIELVDLNSDIPETYDPPCNVKFPYGDPIPFAFSILEPDTNKVHCSDELPMREIIGKCPFPDADPTGVISGNPYVPCPDFPGVPAPEDFVLGSEGDPTSEVQCKKCDLTPNSEKTAVNVQCFECYDIPSNSRPSNNTHRDILYKAHFVAVSNYTSVKVTGWENICA